MWDLCDLAGSLERMTHSYRSVNLKREIRLRSLFSWYGARRKHSVRVEKSEKAPGGLHIALLLIYSYTKDYWVYSIDLFSLHHHNITVVTLETREDLIDSMDPLHPPRF